MNFRNSYIFKRTLTSEKWDLSSATRESPIKFSENRCSNAMHYKPKVALQDIWKNIQIQRLLPNCNIEATQLAFCSGIQSINWFRSQQGTTVSANPPTPCCQPADLDNLVADCNVGSKGRKRINITTAIILSMHLASREVPSLSHSWGFWKLKDKQGVNIGEATAVQASQEEPV